MIDMKKLKELVKLMTENDLTELDLKDDKGEHVTLKRGGAGGPVHYAPPPVHAAPPPTAAPPATAGGDAAPVAAADDGLVPIVSPMVGTFYSSPSPDADPFISVGDSVSDESVVCIVEAMKVFNEIKAETTGTVAKVLIENGQPVEFGQPMFLIKPN